MIARLLRLMTPRYLVQAGMLTPLDLSRLADSRTGDLVQVEGNPGSITPLPMPTIHLHLNKTKPRRTAAMGQSRIKHLQRCTWSRR